MRNRPKRNLPASILARLLSRARETGDDYQALVTVYASERFLYRLGVSPARDQFILKGAMLFRVWSGQPYRATRDLDLLHRGEGGQEAIRKGIEAILATEVEPDGLMFDVGSLRLEAIRPEDEYAGVRITMRVRCGSFRTTLQVDVGVGDVVWPPAAQGHMSCLLGMPEPQIFTYSPNSVIAEKLEAIVVLGDRNSRIKDFFDIRYLAEHRSFDRATLAEAIRRTFAQRKTPVPQEVPFGLTEAYWETPGREVQVRAFAARSGLEVAPETLRRIPAVICLFLLPILDDVRSGQRTEGTWAPPGPWR